MSLRNHKYYLNLKYYWNQSKVHVCCFIHCVSCGYNIFKCFNNVSHNCDIAL